MSFGELSKLHESVRREVMRLTDALLLEMINAGHGTQVSSDPTYRYKYTKDDFQSIVAVFSDPARGVIHAVLPRNGNEAAYELHDLQLALAQVMKERKLLAAEQPR